MSNFTRSSYRISVLLRLKRLRDFVIRKLVRKQEINLHAVLQRFQQI